MNTCDISRNSVRVHYRFLVDEHLRLGLGTGLGLSSLAVDVLADKTPDGQVVHEKFVPANVQGLGVRVQG